MRKMACSPYLPPTYPELQLRLCQELCHARAIPAAPLSLVHATQGPRSGGCSAPTCPRQAPAQAPGSGLPGTLPLLRYLITAAVPAPLKLPSRRPSTGGPPAVVQGQGHALAEVLQHLGPGLHAHPAAPPAPLPHHIPTIVRSGIR